MVVMRESITRFGIRDGHFGVRAWSHYADACRTMVLGIQAVRLGLVVATFGDVCDGAS